MRSYDPEAFPTQSYHEPFVSQPVLAQPVGGLIDRSAPTTSLDQPVVAQSFMAQPVMAQPVTAQPVMAQPVMDTAAGGFVNPAAPYTYSDQPVMAFAVPPEHQSSGFQCQVPAGYYGGMPILVTSPDGQQMQVT